MPSGNTTAEPTQSPAPNADNEPTFDADQLRYFSRSPHPYHQRGLTFKGASGKDGGQQPRPALAHSSPPASFQRRGSYHSRGRGDEAKSPRASSQSGSEADDEGYGLVKALPAPPMRPRKGLRGRSEDDDSPFLTPSQLEPDGRRKSTDYSSSRKDRNEKASGLKEEEARVREKLSRRRRAEHIRRVVEIVLLGVIGHLVLANESVWIVAYRRDGVMLICYGLIVSTLFLLYPLRLAYHVSKSTSRERRGVIPAIHIPNALDPAPVLYPAFLPLLVALSLTPSSGQALLANTILSLASLQVQLIPYLSEKNGIDVVHWIVTVLPLIIPETLGARPEAYEPGLRLAPQFDSNVASSLFPLHQSLLPLLLYLTRTSLLSAELQLLSISMINLLLLSESPQMIILETLLWVGGLFIFLLCGHVIGWGVALARIPRWRLKRAGHMIKDRQSFLAVLNGGLAQDMGFGLLKGKQGDNISDADEDDLPLRRLNLKNHALRLVTSLTPQQPSDHGTRSAVEGGRVEEFSTRANEGSSMGPTHRRRNTLPSMRPSDIGSSMIPEVARKRQTSSTMRSFLSLTPNQAIARKWLYAGYLYCAIVIIILVPVRICISRFALGGYEPFGWAIGYLLGDIPSLRLWVYHFQLEDWIPLPEPHKESAAREQHSSVEHIRSNIIGAANVRLLLCAYCISILVIGMLAVLRLTSMVEVDTRRKVFHGMMVAMILPTTYIDPLFVSLALALVLAIFLLLDLIRASQLPPLSKPLAYFLTPYVDGRDLRGPVVVSHIFLLIGCAIPLWLSLAGIPRSGEDPWHGWEIEPRNVGMVAGVVCVGMGDAAASLIGRRYGRHKWPWAGGKSIEGSAAFAAAVTAGLLFAKAWLGAGGWKGYVQQSWDRTASKAALSACGASLMEAVLTGGNDNVVVPVALWLLVRAVEL